MIILKSPLEHFEFNIFTYFNNYFSDFSLNSGNLYLLSLIFFFPIFILPLLKPTLLPNKMQLSLEGFFFLLLDTFKQQVKSPRAFRYLPLIFTLFLYIFLLNFTSLYMFGVSLTGHIIITGFCSFSLFLSLIFIGFLNYGKNFLNFFVPQGVPRVLLDFIIIIEVFSFAIRPFSLAIRLFANMLAGHTLLGIFSKFAVFILKNFLFLLLLPLIMIFLIFFLEIAVSLIQAYIFVSLICIYLNDVTNLH